MHVKVKVTRSCPTLLDPMDYTVHRILQARILEWVAFLLSRGSSQPRDQTQVSQIAADSLPAEPQEKPSLCILLHYFLECISIHMFLVKQHVHLNLF